MERQCLISWEDVYEAQKLVQRITIVTILYGTEGHVDFWFTLQAAYLKYSHELTKPQIVRIIAVEMGKSPRTVQRRLQELHDLLNLYLYLIV